MERNIKEHCKESKKRVEMSNGVNVIFWNVAGLSNKDEDFWNYLEQFDVICLTETWLTDEEWQKWKGKVPKQYKWKCQAAKKEKKRGRAKGGIITGVREEIIEEATSTIAEGLEERRMWIEGEEWRIWTVYEKGKELKKMCEEIDERREKILLIGGDMNSRIGEKGSLAWREEGEKGRGERRSKDKKINPEGVAMIKSIEERVWMVLNGNKEGDEKGEWTYEKAGKKSVIDYGVVNWEAWERVEKFEVESRIDSDHQPIIVRIKGKINRKKEVKERRMIQEWTAEGIEVFKNNVREIQWQNEDVQEEWAEMVEKLGRAIKTRERKERKSTGWKPWWNKECWEGKREVVKALRKRKAGKINDDEMKEVRKKYKELCEKNKQEWRENEIAVLNGIKTETEAWNYVNKERKKKMEMSEEVTMEEWKKHFMNLLGGQESRCWDESVARNDMVETEAEVTHEEVDRQIRKMKLRKAAGGDGLRNEVWKLGGEEVQRKLTSVVRKVWRGDGYPEEWNGGVIMPIWKRGSKEEVKNYRGVTLSCTGYKVYASILNERIVKDGEEKGVWRETQAGFRKGRGTMDNISVLKHIVGRRIEQGRKVYGFFIDLKAAFDNMDRNELWETMRKKGIREGLIERVKETYKETRCKVKVGDKETEEFWTRKGVRQGCPLSPTLFNIYLADLGEELSKGVGGIKIGARKIWSLEYADDVVILAEGEEAMKETMNRLERYLRRKKLELSVEKSHMIVFRKGGRRRKKVEWKWKNGRIEEVDGLKYLGYTIRSNNGDVEHVRDRLKKAQVAMRAVWGIGERRFKGDAIWRMKLYDAVVGGIMSYGAEVWGWKEWKELERLEEKYMRWILGLDGKTPGYIVKEELKRRERNSAMVERAMKWDEKMRKGQEGQLLRECFRERRRDEEQEIRSEWSRNRIEFIKKCGVELEEVARWMDNEEPWMERLKREYEERQKRRREEAIDQSKYSKRYKEIKVDRIPGYITEGRRRGGEWIRSIARIRCGCEEMANKYWLDGDKIGCKLCEIGIDTLEHAAKDCTGMREWEGEVNEIAKENGEGFWWIREWLERKNEAIKVRQG